MSFLSSSIGNRANSLPWRMIFSMRSIFLLSAPFQRQNHKAVVMQFVNDASIADPEPVPVTALKFLNTVAHRVKACRQFSYLRSNPLLRVDRYPISLRDYEFLSSSVGASGGTGVSGLRGGRRLCQPVARS